MRDKSPPYWAIPVIWCSSSPRRRHGNPTDFTHIFHGEFPKNNHFFGCNSKEDMGIQIILVVFWYTKWKFPKSKKNKMKLGKEREFPIPSSFWNSPNLSWPWLLNLSYTQEMSNRVIVMQHINRGILQLWVFLDIDENIQEGGKKKGVFNLSLIVKFECLNQFW